MMHISLSEIIKSIRKRSVIYIYSGVFVSVILFILAGSITFKSVQSMVSRPDPFRDIELVAKSVYVFDESDNKVLYEKDAFVSMPVASITKLVSVKCALDTLGIDTYIDVPRSIFRDSLPTEGYMTDTLTVKNLAIMTLIESSNTGAEILAEKIGMQQIVGCMNREMQESDLLESKFYNVTGLDINFDIGGGYSSAENVVRILQSVVRAYPGIYTKTANSDYDITTKNGTIHRVINTNAVSNELVGLLASKTGFTNLAGGNLTFVLNTNNNHNVYVSLLGGTQESRFNDALIINKKILEYYK
jgi:D-alanyl-D-alanine carboxypeptidase